MSRSFAPPIRKIPIAFGLTTLTCELIGPGQIEASYKGRGETYLWPSDGQPTASMEKLCSLINQGGINTALEPDIELKIWKKLVVNCCLNTMCAIANQNVGQVVSDPAVWTFLDGVVDEIAAAAKLKNVLLAADEARAFLRSVADEARNHEPSMLIDIRNGRKTEIDCLNGAVLRICEQHGLAAPRNQALYTMIRAIERRAGVLNARERSSISISTSMRRGCDPFVLAWRKRTWIC